MSSMWRATIANPSLELAALIGMPECADVRSDEARQGRIVGWLR